MVGCLSARFRPGDFDQMVGRRGEKDGGFLEKGNPKFLGLGQTNSNQWLDLANPSQLPS